MSTYGYTKVQNQADLENLDILADLNFHDSCAPPPAALLVFLIYKTLFITYVIPISKWSGLSEKITLKVFPKCIYNP